MNRVEPLCNNEYYHVYSRSIAKFVIFNSNQEYQRMMDLLDLYRFIDFTYKYSQFNNLNRILQNEIKQNIKARSKTSVEIIAFCLMPTHFHLILKQIQDKGITLYLSRVLNGYTKYFNTKHQRFGPLWSERFKSKLIKSDEQLLHLTRYIHLNPSSSNLVKDPRDWSWSSYPQYLNQKDSINIAKVPNFEINYKNFTTDRINYQKELSLIKNIIIENNTK